MNNKRYLVALLNLIEKEDIINCIIIFTEDIIKELINGKEGEQ